MLLGTALCRVGAYWSVGCQVRPPVVCGPFAKVWTHMLIQGPNPLHVRCHPLCRASLNQFSDMTYEEFRRLMCELSFALSSATADALSTCGQGVGDQQTPALYLRPVHLGPVQSRCPPCAHCHTSAIHTS